MTRIALVLLALLASFGAPANAAWGERDCTFGTGGSVTVTGLGAPFTLVPEATGNILVRSGFKSTSSSTTRMSPDGAILGSLSASSAGPGIEDVTEVVLPSGNILYATGQSQFSISVVPGVKRLLPNGSIDSTFGNGGTATISGLAAASAGPVVQPDGKILIGGANSAGNAVIARFNADGTPDATFGTGGMAANTASGATKYRSIAVQADGRIVAIAPNNLWRHLADGQVDTSFGSGGNFNPSVYDGVVVRVLGTGNILFVGTLWVTGTNRSLQLILVDSAGAPVASKTATTSHLAPGSNEIGLNYSPASPIHIMADGRIVITGAANGTGVIARYSMDLDEEVSAVLDDRPTVSLVLPTGKILIGAGQQVRRLLGESDSTTCTPTTTTMTSSPNPSVSAQSVTLTATVSSASATPTGTVQFKDGGSNVGTPVALSGGVATLSTSSLSTGSRQLTATYLPAGAFMGSTSSPITHVVNAALRVSDATGNSAPASPTMAFVVTMPSTAASTVTVQYATADNTAIAGVDYTATSGTVTFPPGTSNSTVFVPLTQRSAPHPNKTLFLTLSNPTNAVITKGTGIGTIVYASSGALSLYVDDPAVLEGQAGITLLGFGVRLSRAHTATLTVDYATADDTGVADTDYTAKSGTLTFRPGQTQQWIMVPVLGNLTDEPNRQLFVNISNASAGVIAKAQGVGTIVDDDPVSAAATVPMYRLYSNVTKEHLYTTDANEYAVLANNNWVQEGTAYTMFEDSGSHGSQYTIPLYRMYHPGIQQHHWTTDANEVMVLASQGAWQYEDIAGYLLASADAGSTPLYRLMYHNPPLHLWTTDANEKDVLSTQYGWVYEGVTGEVLP